MVGEILFFVNITVERNINRQVFIISFIFYIVFKIEIPVFNKTLSDHEVMRFVS